MKHGQAPFIVFAIIVVMFFGAWVFLSASQGSFSSPQTASNNPKTNLQDILSRTAQTQTTATSVQDLVQSTQINLTDKLAGNLSSDFITTMGSDVPPSGIGGDITSFVDSQNFDIDQVAASLSQDAPLFVTSVPDADIIVSQDQSPQAIRTYTQQYTVIMTQAGGLIGEDAGVFLDILSRADAGDTSQLATLANDIHIGITQLQQLSVPTVLKDFHKQSLAVFLNVYTVLDAIVKSEQDPLRAYVAVKDIAPHIPDQVDTVTALFSKISKAYNL